MKLILFSARPWSFKDDKTGQQRDGVTVQYSDGIAVNAGNEKGIFPMTFSASPEIWHQLTTLPAVYECDLKMRPGKDNKATLTLTGVKFVEALSLAAVCE
jgi:hypothetical protein